MATSTKKSLKKSPPAAKKAVAKKTTAPKVPAQKSPKKIKWPSGKNAFEQACKILGLKPILPGVKGLPVKHVKHIIADYKLLTIIEATNRLIAEPSGVFPRYDISQNKYFDWKWVKADAKNPGGVGFSSTDDGSTGTDATVGSRFFFKTPEARAHLRRKEFNQLWVDYLLIPKG